MAIIPQHASLDFNKVGQLLNARLHNIATTADLATLAGTLGAGNAGLVVFCVEDDRQHVWDGAAFQPLRIDVLGTMVYRGSLSAAEFTTLPANFTTGSQFTTAEVGTLAFAQTWNAAPGNEAQQITITYVPTNAVNAGSTILVEQTGTRAYTVYVTDRNGNVGQATEADLGLVRIATSAEVAAGANDVEAVTPLKLKERIDTLKLARFNVQKNLNLTANVALTITHNLALSDAEGFTYQVMVGGAEVVVEATAVDANSFQFTSNSALANATVTTIGW
jgi:hypothetical protein